MTKRWIVACLSAVLLALADSAAWPQAGRTIRIVVPFPPGGSADILARLVGQQATQASGQRIVVENRPGAGTIIATEAVARAAPDGTTVLVMSNSFVINGIVRASLPYDPMTSFEPVCFLIDSPQVLVVNDASPYRTLKDLVDAAKQWAQQRFNHLTSMMDLNVAWSSLSLATAWDDIAPQG